MKYLLVVFSALFFSACHSTNHHGDHHKEGGSCSHSEKGAYFIAPNDGESVKSKFTVRFGINGMKIRPASDMTEGTGHHHLIIDGAPVAKGTVVAKDEKNIHFGQGQSETELTLAPGKHTLTLQFADGAHSSYGESWSKTITVDVK
ncbi:MAG: DUF4399 domain-containing protein [Pseudomonadota bacterium]|nr:DUF4399 domain-containing protein [Pseudomonadota bacterium]